MKNSDAYNKEVLRTAVAGTEDGTNGGARAYEPPKLQRHADLPVITAVQSCDFFSADGCS